MWVQPLVSPYEASSGTPEDKDGRIWVGLGYSRLPERNKAGVTLWGGPREVRILTGSRAATCFWFCETPSLRSEHQIAG